MSQLTFADYFNVSTKTINDYGAINPCIAYDLPLFIDPFLIFASQKPEYKELHNQIINYMKLLYQKSQFNNLGSGTYKHLFVFSEIKQNWFGYSESGNSGCSGANKMGKSLRKNLKNIFDDFGIEELKNIIHLSEINIIEKGIGKDNISDFIMQLILDYLLTYTQNFTQKYIDKSKQINKTISNAIFDYDCERWLPKTYILPNYNNDFVILIPKDIVVREELWINKEDMLESFTNIPKAISNMELRDTLSNYYFKALPQVKKKDGSIRDPYKKEMREAAAITIYNNPVAIKYYLKYKELQFDKIAEKHKEKIQNTLELETNIIPNLASKLAKLLLVELQQTKKGSNSYQESLKRVKYLKKVIENQDGYKQFYHKGCIIGSEEDLQNYFKAVWYDSKFNVDAEVNNGRGPVDFKVSYGSNDQTLIEFKLARNTQIKHNLQKQVEIYAAANNNPKIIKVIMFYTLDEEIKIKNILKELNMLNNKNIILIDARNDNKQSASKVKK